MATVKVIEPQAIQPERLRVAAYCRVSSDSKDQLHSYTAQIRSYTEEIAQHDGWELVDVYADEGLTGTRMDKREDFNRMMRDCRKGKIDRILVSSYCGCSESPEYPVLPGSAALGQAQGKTPFGKSPLHWQGWLSCGGRCGYFPSGAEKSGRKERPTAASRGKIPHCAADSLFPLHLRWKAHPHWR